MFAFSSVEIFFSSDFGIGNFAENFIYIWALISSILASFNTFLDKIFYDLFLELTLEIPLLEESSLSCDVLEETDDKSHLSTNMSLSSDLINIDSRLFSNLEI